MRTETSVVIKPAQNVLGNLRLPGDKSISHRYAMLAGIANGISRFENFSTGADCASTLGCLRSLGVDWEHKDGAVIVTGRGPKLSHATTMLDCGNSGSTMRMLSGILAGQDFISDLRGDNSLSRRPMARIIAPLTLMGAKVEAQEGGRPPLKISGGKLEGISYQMPVASAQVKSSLLFAGLFAEGETCVHESVRTRDHGEIALAAFGASLRHVDRQIWIRGGQQLHAIDAVIPGDLSSAAFFLCAAALFPGSQLTIAGLLLNPTRARLLDILILLGVGIEVSQIEQQNGELVGTVQVQGRQLKQIVIAGEDTASLIDEIPVLAAIAPFSEGGIEIRDAKELRLKESDRIAAVATNLRRMGAEVEEREDGMKIAGGQRLRGAELDSFGDHRIAMAFAVAGLRAEGDTKINGADAAVISYPAFFETLQGVVEQL